MRLAAHKRHHPDADDTAHRQALRAARATDYVPLRQVAKLGLIETAAYSVHAGLAAEEGCRCLGRAHRRLSTALQSGTQRGRGENH